jgi:hypothetical protein
LVTSWPTWDEWLATLPLDVRDSAISLAARFEELGAPDSEVWVRSEISENIPQLARFMILRSLWREAISPWMDVGALNDLAAARRLIDAGADPHDVLLVARAGAYDAVAAAVGVLDEGGDPDAGENAPGWHLVETDAECNPTGRDIGGLHESLCWRRTRPTSRALTCGGDALGVGTEAAASLSCDGIGASMKMVEVTHATGHALVGSRSTRRTTFR